MSDVAVRRLALTLSRGASASGARARAEDALRCADADPRLLLVRRVSLGVLPGAAGRAQPAWSARVDAALRAAAGSAVHAGAPGAEQAQAVFFTDALEARAWLMRLLVIGARPAGWFWRLAVPEWDGGAWAEAAPCLLRAIVARPGGTGMAARTVAKLLEAGQAAALMAPISRHLALALLPALRDTLAPVQIIPGEARAVADRMLASAAPNRPETVSAALVTAVLARSPARATRALSEQLRARGPDNQTAHWLAAQLLLDAAPHLADQPAVLASAAGALCLTVASPPSAEAKRPEAASTTLRFDAHPAGRKDIPFAEIEEEPGAPERGGAGVAKRESAASSLPRYSAPVSSASNVPRVDETGGVHELPDLSIEARSEAAGLFLLIRPLIRLALPERLASRPDLAAAGFGWSLLRAVARRQLLAPADPIWRVLPDIDAESDECDAWRVGLDRWLRRRAGMGLSAVVKRPGWLITGEGTTSVRFRLDDADIRLRRQAIDVDPGWVAWLGHSIRFVYADRPAWHPS